ncbi:MAG TPA: ATP-binding protein [Chloroflexota bacterium]|nr:ATP-binding protein [Chloroflexota bacterium]
MRRELRRPRLSYLGRANLPLQWQIGLLMLTGVLVLYGLFAGWGTLLAEENVRQRSAERLTLAHQTARFFDLEFEEQFGILEASAAQAATMLEERVVHESAMRGLLPHLKPFVRSAFITDRGGRVRWTSRPDSREVNADLGAQPYVRGPLATGARYASSVHPGESDGHPTVVFAVPVRGTSGVPLGVLGASIDPNHTTFQVLVVAAQQLGQTGHAELVDQDLRSIVSSRTSRVSRSSAEDADRRHRGRRAGTSQNGGTAITSGEPGRGLREGEHREFYRSFLASRASGVGLTAPLDDEDADEPGGRHVMAFVSLESVPWGVAVGDSEAAFSAVSHRWRALIAPLGALAVATTLFLVWVTRVSIVRPVLALTQSSRRFAGGDLATSVPHVGRGEVRVLAEALDEMRLRLRDALEAAAVEQSRYQGIVESMTDAVFTTDTHQRITAFNPAAEDLTGWRAEAVLGTACFETVTRGADRAGGAHEGPADRETCLRRCPLLSATAAPWPAVTRETIRRPDGRLVVTSISRAVIRGHDGTPKGIVHVLRDVSAEEELSRLKDEFLAAVSHELRTPLGCVKGYATTLLLPNGLQDDAVTRHCLEVIAAASDELEELVANLLDMTKIGAGALDVNPAPIQLRPLVLAAVERVRPRATGHNFHVTVNGHLPLVDADPHRVEQVLYNLLDNAIKYSPGWGRIEISATAGGGDGPAGVRGAEVCVSVADEGLGVPAELLGHLFERFQREASGRTRGISGTGLGLAICKGIVEAHGGRIWAESPVPGRAHGTRRGRWCASSSRWPDAPLAGSCRPQNRPTPPLHK